ncbi:Uncharacterised protein [Bordetella pertussis]|nr:Uncharacterised protein [Bordetella pertussis]CPN57565.1 Uncharacterised protein [Bordetella pertussis]CPO59239.1 Uncharacterised protein [Bordetella pertussis]
MPTSTRAKSTLSSRDLADIWLTSFSLACRIAWASCSDSSGEKARTRRMIAPVDMSNSMSTMRFHCRHRPSSVSSWFMPYQKSIIGLDHISRRFSSLSSSCTIWRDFT